MHLFPKSALSTFLLVVAACGSVTEDMDAGPNGLIDAAAGAFDATNDAGQNAAGLEFSETEHDFGNVVVGQVSATYTATIANTGSNAAVSVFTVLTGDSPQEFMIVQDTCNNRDLATGNSCSIALEFRPTAPTTSSASLLVGAEGIGSATMTLAGIGLNPGNISIAPTPHDYGEVLVGASSGSTFSVTNTGDVTLPAPTVALSNSSEFSVTQNGCTSDILGAMTCQIVVTYAPTSGGPVFATLTLTSGSDTTSASLKGTGTAAIAATKSGAGSGTVTGPAGLDCGTICAVMVSDPTVTLSQSASSGSEFIGWSMASCGASADCTFDVTAADMQVNAEFGRLFLLTVAKDGAGSGTVTSNIGGIDCGTSCSTSVSEGTSVTLTATPAVGSVLSGWSGCDSATGSDCIVAMSQAKNVTATFVPEYLVTVGTTGTAGTVTSIPAGIDCGTDCSELYPAGTQVTLRATAGTESKFVRWIGPCTNGNANSMCVVNVNAALSVTAEFATNYELKLTIGTVGSVDVSTPSDRCIGPTTCSYDYGSTTTVRLTARVVGTGCSFGGWGGACSASGTSLSCTLTLNSSQTVQTLFIGNCQ